MAYHLLWALHNRLGLEEPKDYADIATIGTIADVAPLLGENRALINEGLARLANSKWPGLRAAIKQARLQWSTKCSRRCFHSSHHALMPLAD